jgi:phosphoglycolate phosphatase-like HAD superfamily hydrolase
VICGQEAGNKREILSVAAAYTADRRLMIGDAPGDFKAANANDCLFYPINPGHEEASWRRFHDEAIDRFLTSTFSGAYQQQLLDEFDTYLPEHPPWSAE